MFVSESCHRVLHYHSQCAETECIANADSKSATKEVGASMTDADCPSEYLNILIPWNCLTDTKELARKIRWICPSMSAACIESHNQAFYRNTSDEKCKILRLEAHLCVVGRCTSRIERLLVRLVSEEVRTHRSI